MLFLSFRRYFRKMRKSISLLFCFIVLIYTGVQYLEFRKNREISRYKASLQTRAVNPGYVAASEDYRQEAKKVIERARDLNSKKLN